MSRARAFWTALGFPLGLGGLLLTLLWVSMARASDGWAQLGLFMLGTPTAVAVASVLGTVGALLWNTRRAAPRRTGAGRVLGVLLASVLVLALAGLVGGACVMSIFRKGGC